MAKRHEGLYPAGSTATGLAKIFTPGDPLKDAAYAAATGKSLEDTKKLQADNAAAANFRALIARGNATPQELVAAAAYNPSLLAEIPKVHLLQIASDPNASPHDRAVAAQAAGVAYGSTEEGVGVVQGHEDRRAVTAAGPGYAAAGAALQGHRWEHADRVSKQEQDYRIVQEAPEPVYDPVTNTTRWVHKGDLTAQPPGGVVPYSPEAYKAANAPTPYSPQPGSVPQIGRSADLNAAMMHPGAPTFYAPTAPEVQVERNKVTPLIAPGQTEPRAYPGSVVTDQPGYFTAPRTAADTSQPKVPDAITLGENAAIDAEQAIRGQFNVAAGRSDQGYLLDKNGKSVIELPKSFATKLPDLVARTQRYAQYNKGNMTAAAQQAVGEEYGDAGPEGGFTINRGMGLLDPTITFGKKRQPLDLPATPENYPTPSPYNTKPAAKPAGPPVPPPPSPTAVLTTPVQTPAYQPGGAVPYTPPTISLGGNPAPAPTPRLLVQPAPPPAPAPAQPPAPAPNPDTATLLQHAQDAIAAGANAAAVAARLKSQFGIDMPPPPALPPTATATPPPG